MEKVVRFTWKEIMEAIPIPYTVALISTSVVLLMKLFDWLWSSVFKSKDKTDEGLKRAEDEIYKEIEKVEARLTEAHKKLEDRVEKRLTDIDCKLATIQATLAASSAIERPARVCRDYLHETIKEVNVKLDKLMETFSTTQRRKSNGKS